MPREGFKQDARRVLKARQTHEIRKKRGRKKKVGRKRGKPKKKKGRGEKKKKWVAKSSHVHKVEITMDV